MTPKDGEVTQKNGFFAISINLTHVFKEVIMEWNLIQHILIYNT